MNNYTEIFLEVCPQDIENCYNAQIPSQNEDGMIDYYIQAIDLSGKFETLPMAGYFSFSVVGGSPAVSGDINMDDVVNVLDVVLAVNYVLGSTELNDYQQQIADMNNDNIVNILDIILIVNTIIG